MHICGETTAALQHWWGKSWMPIFSGHPRKVLWSLASGTPVSSIPEGRRAHGDALCGLQQQFSGFWGVQAQGPKIRSGRQAGSKSTTPWISCCHTAPLGAWQKQACSTGPTCWTTVPLHLRTWFSLTGPITHPHALKSPILGHAITE